jgi:hypothetical protein
MQNEKKSLSIRHMPGQAIVCGETEVNPFDLPREDADTAENCVNGSRYLNMNVLKPLHTAGKPNIEEDEGWKAWSGWEELVASCGE